MPLTAATFLGDNTSAPLAALAERMCAVGVPVEIVSVGARSSDDARRSAAGIDLVWLCGALYGDLQRDGLFDHDVVGVPVFDGSSEPTYHSVVVSRIDGPPTVDDALDGVVAINESASWSGHRVLRRLVAPRWFTGQVETGSHVASMRAVSAGEAGCAAIDHTIWNSIPGPERGDLREIGRTPSWPAPPLTLRPGLAHERRTAIVDIVLDGRPLPGVVRFEPGDAERYEVMQ